MKPLFSRLLSLILFTGLSTLALAQVPTDNAVRSRFGNEPGFASAPFHWTDSIRWDNVVNIQNFSNQVRKVATIRNTQASPDSVATWWFAFEAAQTQLCNSGGGVIYFPALPERTALCCEGLDSSYYFHESIFIKCSVVLRGARPTVIDAKSNQFAPPTFLEFPRYEYSLLAGTGRGTSNRSAFKAIKLDPAYIAEGTNSFSNIGVVDMDINRARIMLQPSFRTVQVGAGSTNLPNGNPRNVVVMGVRSNNAAYPDQNVPNAGVGQNLWQRWPFRFAGNVNVFVNRNAFVSGNRINDRTNNARNDFRPITPDDFFQNGYVAGNCTTAIDGADAVFSYTNSYGVVVNRLKAPSDSAVSGFISNATPQQEPNLYAPGITINDNWIFKKQRVGIHAAGIGLQIRRNELKDDPNKSTKLNPAGTNCNTNSIATFENRGIDFVGWDIDITNNNIEYYRIRNAYSADTVTGWSADGEGIYFQGPGGGTARGIRILNNVVRTSSRGVCNALNSGQGKGMNGFINSQNIMDVLVEGNDFGGVPFFVDGKGTPPNLGTLSNVVVRNNTNLGNLSMQGCGPGNFAYNNTASATVRPCYIFQPGDTRLRVGTNTCLNESSASCATNQNATLGNPVIDACPNINICAIPQVNNTPTIVLTNPADPIINRNNDVAVTIEANWELQNCDPDSIVLYRNGFKLARQVADQNNPMPNPVSFSQYRTAATGRGIDFLKLAIYRTNDEGNIVFTESRSVQVRYPIIASLEPKTPAIQGRLYPNPSSDVVHVSWPAGQVNKVEVMNLSGKTIETIDPHGAAFLSVGINNLAKGIYLVKLSGKDGNQVIRFVKE